MREFLALPLPESLRRVAGEAGRLVSASSEDWRFVRDEGLHVTIRFLGEVDPSRHAVLDEAWRHAACGVGPVALRLRGAEVLPRSSRPRVVCLGVEDETPEGWLRRLADRTERAACAHGFPPEHRPFAAHVTLARARRGALIARPRLENLGELGAFVASRLVLYGSEPDRGGSRYHELASYPLVAGAP